MNNCQNFNVIPKFLAFNLPHTNHVDERAIRKKLLRSAIKRRKGEKYKLEKELEQSSNEIRSVLSGIDWFIFKSAISKNVKKSVNNVIKTHEKKLKNLTRNKTLPFTHPEVVKNLSSSNLTIDELDLLKNGLDFSIPPYKIKKSDVYTSFETIHRFMVNEIKDKNNKGELKAQLSHLACSYYSSFQPNKSSLKKHGILKKLRSRKDIVILKPDKRNGVVILDRSFMMKVCLKLLVTLENSKNWILI